MSRDQEALYARRSHPDGHATRRRPRAHWLVRAIGAVLALVALGVGVLLVVTAIGARHIELAAVLCCVLLIFYFCAITALLD